MRQNRQSPLPLTLRVRIVSGEKHMAWHLFLFGSNPDFVLPPPLTSTSPQIQHTTKLACIYTYFTRLNNNNNNNLFSLKKNGTTKNEQEGGFFPPFFQFCFLNICSQNVTSVAERLQNWPCPHPPVLPIPVPPSDVQLRFWMESS